MIKFVFLKIDSYFAYFIYNIRYVETRWLLTQVRDEKRGDGAKCACTCKSFHKALKKSCLFPLT